ncbi:MAG: CRISPR-associated protein Cas4 [Thermoproteota archaeon]|jgi:CRISPR-associated exonuclease Cas4
MKSYYFTRDNKTITGTLIWYYFICKREVWLMAHEITPDQDFTPLEIGRAVHEIFYKGVKKEISLEGMKLDFFKRKERIVCEVKTSSRFVESAKFQTLYYLYRLKEVGVEASGEILIPREKKIIRVYLDAESEEKLLNTIEDIKNIVSLEKPLKPIKNPYCKRCAYKDFCWV